MRACAPAYASTYIQRRRRRAVDPHLRCIVICITFATFGRRTDLRCVACRLNQISARGAVSAPSA